jgi:hypothetical protein
MHGIKALFPFAVNPDQESNRNSPQRVCNDREQFNPPEYRSGKGGSVAQCGHECDKNYPDPESNENPDCP